MLTDPNNKCLRRVKNEQTNTIVKPAGPPSLRSHDKTIATTNKRAYRFFPDGLSVFTVQQEVQRGPEDPRGGVRAADRPRAHHQPAGLGLRHRQAAGLAAVQPERVQLAGGGHGVGRGAEVRAGHARRGRDAQGRRRGHRVQGGRDEDAVSSQQEVRTTTVALSFSRPASVFVRPWCCSK